MTYSALHHSRLTDAAMDSQRDRERDTGLALILTDMQGGRCFDCGEYAALEFAHFTRAKGRTSRSMDVIGAMACRRCNLIHDRVCDTLGTDGTLPFEYLTSEGRAERIPTEYPTRAECVRVARAASDEADIQAEAMARLTRAGL